MKPTVGDVLLLIRANHVLDSWSDQQIVDQVFECIRLNAFAFTVDNYNKLTSICLGRWHDKCCMHIIAIAGEIGSLKQLFRYLRRRFPSVNKLTALRDNKPVEYDVKKFYKEKIYG